MTSPRAGCKRHNKARKRSVISFRSNDKFNLGKREFLDAADEERQGGTLLNQLPWKVFREAAQSTAYKEQRGDREKWREKKSARGGEKSRDDERPLGEVKPNACALNANYRLLWRGGKKKNHPFKYILFGYSTIQSVILLLLRASCATGAVRSVVITRSPLMMDSATI